MENIFTINSFAFAIRMVKLNQYLSHE